MARNWGFILLKFKPSGFWRQFSYFFHIFSSVFLSPLVMKEQTQQLCAELTDKSIETLLTNGIIYRHQESSFGIEQTSSLF